MSDDFSRVEQWILLKDDMEKKAPATVHSNKQNLSSLTASSDEQQPVVLGFRKY